MRDLAILDAQDGCERIGRGGSRVPVQLQDHHVARLHHHRGGLEPAPRKRAGNSAVIGTDGVVPFEQHDIAIALNLGSTRLV